MISRFRNKSRFRRLRTNSNGQAQVEFVLCVLFVFFLIVGIIELIMLIYTYNVLADAAKEGVRYAIVHGCDFDSTNCSGSCTTACADAAALNVRNWALNFARGSLHDTSAMTVSVSYPDGTSDAPNRVQVTINYPYQPFFGLGWPTVNVGATAQGRIVY